MEWNLDYEFINENTVIIDQIKYNLNDLKTYEQVRDFVELVLKQEFDNTYLDKCCRNEHGCSNSDRI